MIEAVVKAAEEYGIRLDQASVHAALAMQDHEHRQVRVAFLFRDEGSETGLTEEGVKTTLYERFTLENVFLADLEMIGEPMARVEAYEPQLMVRVDVTAQAAR